MQEILGKIDELYNFLVEKNKVTEVLNKQLSEKKIAMEESFLRMKKLEANVIVREKALKNKEGGVFERKEIDRTLQRVLRTQAQNKDKERELAKREKELKDAERNNSGKK